MAVLSFFVPVFGFIFGGIKKRTDPELGSKCIKAAIWGLVVSAIIYIIYIVAVAGTIASFR